MLGLRPIVSGYHQLDRTLEEAAQIVGARLIRRLSTIILPLVAPAAAAGALLIFLTAFNELTVSALLWSTGSETLGVVFFSFQQGGDSNYAAALGMLTVIVSIALMLSTLLLAGRLPRGVSAVARLTLERLGKLYGAFEALDDVSLEVADGEFVAILGASGCGKTTLLRQVAGFDRPDAGRILIGDTVVSTPERQMPPEERRIGIVFQSYALWPHMTVAENVAYGLTVAGVKDPERARRVRRRARAGRARRLRGAASGAPVGRPAATRRARPLSRDRAVARAARRAARQPRRASARGDGARVRAFPRAHRHDDDLHHARPDRSHGARRPHRGHGQGRVLQFATPSQLYREPADATVAKFIGEGMVVPVQVVAVHGDGTCDVDVFGHRMRMRCAHCAAARGGICLPAGFRAADRRARYVRIAGAGDRA